MRQSQAKFARLERQGGELVFYSSYDPAMVSMLKSQVPATERRWDPDDKVWIITPQYGTVVASIAEQFIGIRPEIPLVLNRPAPTQRLLKIEYIGTTKDRGGGDRSAFGWCDGGWNVIFPEAILLTWFDTEAPRDDKPSTLYAVLGVKHQATQEEIKKAHRRLAIQWHPDRCQEPDAHERFIQIQHAYEVLSNELQRRKYDAGLALEASLGKQEGKMTSTGYRSPLRCGYLLCLGTETLGRFTVQEIKQWEDIVDGRGRVMATSWPAGSDHFVMSWV